MKINVIIEKVHGALAQLGARHTGSVEVTGSSPVCSTYFQAAGEKFSPVIFMLKAGVYARFCAAAIFFYAKASV